MLEVRPALPHEHSVIGELTARVYVAEGYSESDGYALVLADVADRAATATVLVALLDGRLVGSVTVARAGTPYGERAEPGEAVMRMLVTDPDARGAGAGTALVQAAIEDARAAGCSVLRLSTQPEMAAAHRVYARLQFVRTPERDWEPEPGLTLLGYALPLTWCSHCGEPGVQHDQPLEPPRYCTRCRRRMVVQVLPTGWTARCVEHGTTNS